MVTDNKDGTVTITGISPGEFRLYATSGNGTGQQAVLSYLPFTCSVNADYEYPEDPDIVCEAELSTKYQIDNYLIEGGGIAVGGLRGGDWLAFNADFGIVGTKSVTIVGSNGTGSDMKAEIRDGAPDVQTSISKFVSMEVGRKHDAGAKTYLSIGLFISLCLSTLCGLFLYH